MCEVTIENFDQIFTKIKASFQNAKFITVDTEFSALMLSNQNKNSLFDTPTERYKKLKALCEQIIPVQIGLSAFTFQPEDNTYFAEMFTVYIFPRPFLNFDPKFVCQSASFQFLCNYNFDFNKFVYSGIPFINRTQEVEIRKSLGKVTNLSNENDYALEDLVQEHLQIITEWMRKSKEGDTLKLPDVGIKYKSSFDILYFLHKHLRKCFNNSLWTMEVNGEFIVKKVSKQDFKSLESQQNLEDESINNMLGFTKIFRLLVQLKKPIIGHNLLTDLMILYHNFEQALPHSYKHFKKQLSILFPTVYDTKVLAFEVKNLIPKNRMWSKNILSYLFEYFKDGYGRHIALNSPLIDLKNQLEYDHFHNAGWDSYCTGYIFVRMAHIFTANKYKIDSRKFMSCELFASVEQHRNSINLIRCSVSHIQLDGNDPESRRPPCLIVESIKDKPVDISQVTHLLSTYGFVEVKPYSSRGHRAIIAVDNSGSARRILHQFKSHTDFQITQYSLIRHSPMTRAILWSGIVASGALLTWLAHATFKK